MGETPAGVTEAICSGCTYKFQIVRGRLVGRNSRQITLQRKTTKHSGSYRREYELRIELPGPRLEILQFSVPGRDDWIQVRRGDIVAAVHSMRESRREELLEIHDQTTGERYHIARPGSKSASTAGGLSCLLALVAAFLVGAAGAEAPLVVIISAAVWIAGWSILARALAPKHHLAPGTQAALAASQSLLALKQNLQDLRGEALAGYEERSALRSRLEGLRAKMESVGGDLYRERLATVRRAIEAVDAQLAVDRQLLEGYDRSITMIEIEYESGLVADQIPSGAQAVIEQKVAELTTLREYQADLARRIAADQELEAYLRLTQ